jgi:hypothetical protein
LPIIQVVIALKKFIGRHRIYGDKGTCVTSIQRKAIVEAGDNIVEQYPLSSGATKTTGFFLNTRHNWVAS